jgi:hypothetical protein
MDRINKIYRIEKLAEGLADKFWDSFGATFILYNPFFEFC